MTSEPTIADAASSLSKIGEAQAEIPGPEVAGMIQEFWREFRGIYREDVMASSLCAVGPLQSMIGLAIKNGRLTFNSTNEANTKA